jgi:hypothetical protein
MNIILDRIGEANWASQMAVHEQFVMIGISDIDEGLNPAIYIPVPSIKDHPVS